MAQPQPIAGGPRSNAERCGDGIDAIILAESPLSSVAIAGLTVRERALRIARRAGAQHVIAVEDAATRGGLVAWRASRTRPVLVIRADQLVHTPLVAPLLERELPRTGLAVAVGPDHEYAGAFVATGSAAETAVARLARGDGDTAIATLADARVPHGPIARHAVATPADRRAAHRLLYQILIKPQDNAITRYLYRPVAFPVTRLLAKLPITPNQISLAVAAMVAVGCWLTAHASKDLVLAGSALILVSGYLDCCDGEIARLKLLSSRLGAWVDTVVDELSSVGYMAAIGYHCHLAYGPQFFGLPADAAVDPWLVGIAIGCATYLWSIYCIYYNIIVAVGSANSQDYVGRFVVVPAGRPNAVRLRPAAKQAIAPERPLPPWMAAIATYLPYVVRRDFICYLSFVYAALHVTRISFATLWLGGVVSAVILSIDHVKLRRLRRSIVRSGQVLESPSS